MAKKPLGHRIATAVADTTGNNTGQWTVAFDPAAMSIHWTMYEVYKIVININQSAGVVSFTVFIGQAQYEGFQSSTIATWSDVQPMPVDSGETLYFYFNEPSSDGTPPTVTIWIQVDLDIAQRSTN